VVVVVGGDGSVGDGSGGGCSDGGGGSANSGELMLAVSGRDGSNGN